jgi:putative ABC transport system substrate-binding protein
MIPGVGALTQAFEVLSAERPEALIVLSDASFNSARHQIVQFVAENRLAAMYEAREFVEAGGLISYGPNIALMSYRAAAYVDKILKGALPAELRVEEPSTFELHVNLKTARAFGLTIPPTLLARADEVIE